MADAMAVRAGLMRAANSPAPAPPPRLLAFVRALARAQALRDFAAQHTRKGERR